MDERGVSVRSHSWHASERDRHTAAEGGLQAREQTTQPPCGKNLIGASEKEDTREATTGECWASGLDMLRGWDLVEGREDDWGGEGLANLLA